MSFNCFFFSLFFLMLNVLWSLHGQLVERSILLFFFFFPFPYDDSLIMCNIKKHNVVNFHMISNFKNRAFSATA